MESSVARSTAPAGENSTVLMSPGPDVSDSPVQDGVCSDREHKEDVE